MLRQAVTIAAILRGVWLISDNWARDILSSLKERTLAMNRNSLRKLSRMLDRPLVSTLASFAVLAISMVIEVGV